MRPERAMDMVGFDSDALGRVLGGIESLDAAAVDSRVGRRLSACFAHVCQAREVWLARVQGRAWDGGEIFPPAEPVERLRERHESASEKWGEYAKGITAQELSREVAYRSTEGLGFLSTVEDVLLHTFGHSLYHRGQCAHWLSELGAQPPATDYIFWTRRERGG